MKNLEYNISKALGLVTEESDKPQMFKHVGKSKKSAEAAHRPDKGVEYTEMENDTQFQHKADERTIK